MVQMPHKHNILSMHAYHKARIFSEYDANNKAKLSKAHNKIEKLEYIESLIRNLRDLAKQSRESCLVVILNMAITVTQDRIRALSRIKNVL